jgi:hypothetical protein
LQPVALSNLLRGGRRNQQEKRVDGHGDDRRGNGAAADGTGVQSPRPNVSVGWGLEVFVFGVARLAGAGEGERGGFWVVEWV